MERIRLGESVAYRILQVTPEDLRELANKLEARAKVSGTGGSVFMPISNSIAVMYNVPMKAGMIIHEQMFTEETTSRLN